VFESAHFSSHFHRSGRSAAEAIITSGFSIKTVKEYLVGHIYFFILTFVFMKSCILNIYIDIYITSKRENPLLRGGALAAKISTD